MQIPRKRRTQVGGLFFLVSVAFLIWSLLSAWYFASATTSSDGFVGPKTTTSQVVLYPGASYYTSSRGYCIGPTIVSCNGSMSETCPYWEGGSGCPPALGETGLLYLVVLFLLVGGAILGAIGSTLAILSLRTARRWKLARAVGLVATLLALIAPMTLLALQPGALTRDVSSANGQPPTGPGPWSSFFGSCSNSNETCNEPGTYPPTTSFAWNPSAGWYLSLGAGAASFAGLLLVRGAKEHFAQTAKQSQGIVSQ